MEGIGEIPLAVKGALLRIVVLYQLQDNPAAESVWQAPMGARPWEKDMDDKRKRERHHIQAAREWLDGAEESLAGQDEVRGDLRVMLAKAELAHVGAGKQVSLLRRLGVYLLPVLLAGTIAAGLVYGMNQERAGAPGPSAVLQKSKATSEAPKAEEDPLPATLQAEARADRAQPRVTEPVQGALSAQGEPVLPQSTPAQSSEKEAAGPVEIQSSKRAEPPDAETQRLMQTAGKVLRK